MHTDKLEYVYSHISEIEERIETIEENLKWISSDVKVIKKLSKPEKEK
jgi:hypothetical protein